MKSYSPLHGNRPNLPVNNNQPFGYYRPVTQMNPPAQLNKSINSQQFKGGIPNQGQS
jgi:hypothetical protein